MAVDGYKSLTEDQRDDLQDLISNITNVYDDEILMSREAYEASGIEAQETQLFIYVDELLTAKDAEIAQLHSQVQEMKEADELRESRTIRFSSTPEEDERRKNALLSYLLRGNK